MREAPIGPHDLGMPHCGLTMRFVGSAGSVMWPAATPKTNACSGKSTVWVKPSGSINRALSASSYVVPASTSMTRPSMA